MNKLIIEGLEFLELNTSRVEISFLTQSCFPIYLIHLPEEDKRIAVKIVDQPDMAQAEVSSLKYLKEKNCPVPSIYGVFTRDKDSLIYMEYISENNRLDKKEKLLSTLNQLYSNTNPKWGFDEDNFIGALHQKNSFHDNFTSFFWQDRIEVQLKLCLENGIFSLDFINQTERLVYKKVSAWNLNSYTPRLIHGDLWNGNILFSDRAYFIDPSISYSHPEQDLAMLELFGSSLSKEEMEKFLLELGYSGNFQERIPFWQLYPLLVHVNLFGGSYIPRAREVIRYYSSYR